MSTQNYENAAKDIEQEKKMVAALKRLSIGNLMNYDPDLPPDECEFQYQLDELESAALPPREGSTLARAPSVRRLPTRGDDASVSPARSPLRGCGDEAPLLQSHGHVTPPGDALGHLLDEIDGVEDASFDSNPLLWVPANLHPELEPELFKLHLRNTVEGLIEKNLQRSKSRLKRSSLSLSSSHDESEPRDDTPATEPHDEDRFSNPSLRDLTNELEKLSKLAGMDSNDAVTLARTLSTSSLGYTDVERHAFDKMTSPPKKSPSDELDAEPDTSPTRRERRAQYQRRQYVHHQQMAQRQPPRHAAAPADGGDFPLKRSRRLDYRKHAVPAGSGSSLQQTKAEKLHELRSTLITGLTPEVATPTKKLHKRTQAKTNSYTQGSHHRSSQVLFSYRNPNAPPSAPVPQTSRDSPYPAQASPGYRKVSPVGTHRADEMPGGYPAQPSRHTSYSGAAAVPHIKDKVQQRHTPSGAYAPHRSSRRTSPNQHPQHIAYADAAAPQHRHSSAPQHRHSSAPQHRHTSAAPAAPPSGRALPKDKSIELNQNLDLLRSEINQFKESLNAVPASVEEKEATPISQDLDFLFDTSYQDLSYEDTLGIEKDVLGELSENSDSQRRFAIPMGSPAEETLEAEPDTQAAPGGEPEVAPASPPTKPLEASNSAQGAILARTLKKKKSWPWLKERSVSTSAVYEDAPETKEERPARSASNPEPASDKPSEHEGNMITKLFKKKTHAPIEEVPAVVGSGVTVDYESDSDSVRSKKKKGGLFKKKKGKVQMRQSVSNDSIASHLSGHEEEKRSTRETEAEAEAVPAAEAAAEPAVIAAPAELDAGDDEVVVASTSVADTTASEEKPLQSTLEVQEKLKRLIKRTLRANQPLEFTDSAFGFPLPPPLQSTLVMLDYRFPVHVERAIYRLLHLKLANPKRSLREQVLLSNFMYAYLNLVDHTLHLEQQLEAAEAKEDGFEAAIDLDDT
jgi:hypothetical protein